MADNPEEILSLFSKSEELLEMFRKGRAFTEELMRENERLRYRLVHLEREKMDLSATLMREAERLRLENTQLAQKLDFIDTSLKQIEAENMDFAQRYVEVEEQNESLANLYVASYRLHSTLDPVEVVECIKEILVNLIGTEEFGLYVVDESAGGLTLTGYEGEIAVNISREGDAATRGIEGLVATSGEPVFAEDAGELGEAYACIPLKIKDRVVGVIAIYRLLSHKDRLNSLDHRLLDLLAGHAASALVSSKLYAAADRKLRTIEGVMNLLRVQ